MMHILIIGGTRFQGKYLVDDLIGRGHDVTVFHRGTTPLANPRALEIKGDRNDTNALSKLRGNRFDWLIDTCAYIPNHIRTTIATIRDTIDRYCLISTAYVFKPTHDPIFEDSEKQSYTGSDEPLSVTAENYGALKVLCEQELLTGFPETSLIVRPGVLIGPGDHTGRFAFWVRLISRLQRGILPSPSGQNLQLLDVRDLVSFTVQSIEKNRTGDVNVTTPPVSFRDLIQTLSDRILRVPSPLLTFSSQDIHNAGIDMSALPLFRPLISENYQIERALSWGFAFRNLSQTTDDVLKHEERRGFADYPFAKLEEALLTIFK